MRALDWLLLGALIVEVAVLGAVVAAGVFLRWLIPLASAALLLPAAASVGVAIDARVRHAYQRKRPREPALLGTALAFALVAAALALAGAIQLTVLLVECATTDGTGTGEATDALYVSVLCNDELAYGIAMAIAAYLAFVCEAVRVGVYAQTLSKRLARRA